MKYYYEQVANLQHNAQLCPATLREVQRIADAHLLIISHQSFTKIWILVASLRVPADSKVKNFFSKSKPTVSRSC